MPKQGLYIVFEGTDMVGKTTTMHAVAKVLRESFSDRNIVETHHPGSTPLGAHLRQLVKFPHQIDPTIKIDDLSRQMLYMVDTISFIRSQLEPLLSENAIVLADRSSFISAMAYGLADGLQYSDIQKLFEIIDAPMADRVYVLQCPNEIKEQRRCAGRDQTDHYDKKNEDFKTRLSDIYDHLVTGPSERSLLMQKIVSIDNLKYIDTNRSNADVVSDIVNDICRLIY